MSDVGKFICVLLTSIVALVVTVAINGNMKCKRCGVRRLDCECEGGDHS